MSIDRSRLKEYLQEMRSLEGRVSEVNFIERFKQKLLDLLARKQIDTDDITFIRKQVRLLFKPEFANFDTEILRTYNDVLDVVNTLYDDIGPDITRQFEKVKNVQQTNRLQLNYYQDSTVEGIARAVRKGIVQKMSYPDIAGLIADVGGRATDYAQTLAKTQVKRFARISKYNKSLVAGVEYYEYAGILHETIRPFCYACLHQIFGINQLLKMKNGNLEPVIINCGGWNCIHDLEPDPTATAGDAVSGKLYSLDHGARIYGDEGVAKKFSYSFGLDAIANGEGVKSYIAKCRKQKITDDVLDHFRSHHPDLYDELNDAALRAKVGYIRHNPDRLYYQHNARSGPGIVFEKDGEFLFISARKIKSMFTPGSEDAIQKYYENNVQYFRRLHNYE